MFHNNLVSLRKLKNMTQEGIAEKVGVSRQAVAKWEAGETVPDLDKCKILAELFGVSLDDLANYEPDENMGFNLPPKGKYLFGMVTVGDKGQIVIPAKARKLFDISAGDQLVILGDEGQGLAVLKTDRFLAFADAIRNGTLEQQ
ncbi:MAG: helix-turn-helix domain-containing protein [Ruminococcaceae bacterium]|nr:helix-turn-helix domain-containing protein [Oscillospiraceae bacterium]